MKKCLLLGIVVPVLLFSVIALLVFSGASRPFEAAAYNLVSASASAPLTYILIAFTTLGSPAGVAAICVIFLVIPRLRETCFLPLAASTLLAAGLNQILKLLFRRIRPDELLWLVEEHGFSFPSGHAMTNAALYCMLLFLARHCLENPVPRTILSVLCAGTPLAIGYSRVYLGVHHACDVLAGWLLGTAVATAVYELRRRIEDNSPRGYR